MATKQNRTMFQLVPLSNHELATAALESMGWADQAEINEVIGELAATGFIIMMTETEKLLSELEFHDEWFSIFVTNGDGDGQNRWYDHRVLAFKDKDGNIWADADQCLDI